jgi:hypothetical protein
MKLNMGPMPASSRRPKNPQARSRNMAPWDEFADDAAIESDFYVMRTGSTLCHRTAGHPELAR